jgi:hypothetical protein
LRSVKKEKLSEPNDSWVSFFSFSGTNQFLTFFSSAVTFTFGDFQFFAYFLLVVAKESKGV